MRARKQALAGTAVLAAMLGPSHACGDGDPAVKVIAPFDLYDTPASIKYNEAPLGHFSSGDACIDNGLNQAVSPPQGWTWIYFKSGLRDFKGVASLSAFQAIVAERHFDPNFGKDAGHSCLIGHWEGNMCVRDGRHLVGNDRTCLNGTHGEGSQCVRDGEHSVGGGFSCLNGMHREEDKCVLDGKHLVAPGRTCFDGEHLDEDNECVRDKDAEATAKAEVDAWMASPAGKEAVAQAKRTQAEEVKVDPPICETTIVKEVFPADKDCRDGNADMEAPWAPQDGDFHSCYGAGAGGISYINGKHQNGEYAYVPAMENSRPGDKVVLCLVSYMKDCPPGDDRGTTYTALNLRTRGRWRKPNASHSCGGA